VAIVLARPPLHAGLHAGRHGERAPKTASKVHGNVLRPVVMGVPSV